MDVRVGSVDEHAATDADGPRVTPAGDPIMAAKFSAAAIGTPVLLRPRLLARLSAGAQGPLTLISAPAGSGKTVLASSWASDATAPGPVTWITLDDEDGRPGLFWSYVLEGLARGGLRLSDVGLPRLVDEVDRSLLIRLAVRLSEAADPVVLILDNAERLATDRVADEIDFVLRHSAGQLRAVLVSRVDPNLPLHRYRLAGSVTEIRFPELAFTADEAKALLNGQAAGLSDGAVLAFIDHTNGWAAGLRLGGARPDGGEPAPAAGAVARGDLAAYFRAEVLEAQPPGFRHLLLTTSVVDPLPAELAVALSGRRDAVTTLRVLAEAGAFVERSADADGCYRYHPLVRELLQAELSREAPARQRALHRKAARWLAAAGRGTEAVGQYAAAQDWPAAARLLVDELAVARLLTAPPDEGLAAVFAGMPAAAPDPCGAVVAAALALGRHDLTAAATLLRPVAPDATPDVGQPAGPLRLAVAVTAATLASVTGDAAGTLSAAATARGLAAELAGGGRPGPPETMALLDLSVGAAHLGRGDLDAARERLAAAARTANRPGCEHLRMRCLGRLALAEAIAGRLRRAAGCANRALALAGSGAAAGRLQPATVDLALAWVGTERADGQQSRGSTAAAATNPETGRDPVAVGALALVRSRLARGRGDLVGAVTALRQARAADPPPPRWLRDRIDAAEAMVLVAQGRAEAALGLLSRPSAVSPAGSAQRAGAGGPGDPAGRGGAGGPARPEDPAAELVLARGWAQLETGAVAAAADAVRQAAQRSRLPLDVQVDTLLLAAAVELGESRPEVAREALGRAARLAEPERLRRPFQQAMPRLRRILREQDVLAEYSWWAGTGATGAHRVGPPHRVGAHPAAAGGPGAAPHADPAVIVQPLTEREREVLTHLAALLSTEEIAGRMFLSVNTVKTHVRAILRKLAAERRNEAVRRARKLGLV